MNYLNFILNGLLVCLCFADYIFSQSICFDRLRDGQIRSDYYSPELVCIPTEYSTSSSPNRIIEGSYSTLEVIKENVGNIGNYDSHYGPIPDLYVGTGTYTLKLRYHEKCLGEPHFVTRAEHVVTIHEKFSLKIINNFPGGVIDLDGNIVNSGQSCLKFADEPMMLSAIDQEFGGNNYVWKDAGTNPSYWNILKGESGGFVRIEGTNSRSYNHIVQSGDNNAVIKTDMRKVWDIQIKNIISGQTNKGQIWIDEIPHASPYHITAVQGDQITLTASEYEENGMLYVFDHWEDGSTSSTRTVEVSNSVGYTAYFKGTPIYMSTFRDLLIDNSRGEYLILNWTEHPNPLVTSYKIQRKVLKPPLADRITQIGQVPRGTLTFTDYDYYNYGTKYQDMLFYDVAACCDSENTSSETIWCGVFYGTLIKGSDSTKMSKSEKEQILENKLSNYPNPFNPSTQIRYSLKEGGMVALQIYDILGNKVADLVNKYQPAGTYYTNFDGADKPTGIYICSLKSNNYSETKKLLLIK